MALVLVARPHPEVDRLVTRLTDEGFEALAAPVLQRVEADWQALDLRPVQALVFTSAYAVRLFAARVALPRIKVFCVGAATARAAQASGFADVTTGNGTGAELVELIRNTLTPADGEILHPGAEELAYDSIGALKQHGFCGRHLVIYKSKFLDALPPDADAALERGHVDAVLLTSVRTARAFGTLAKGRIGRTFAVCISDAVAQAATAWGFVHTVHGTSPNIDAMIDRLHDLFPPAQEDK